MNYSIRSMQGEDIPRVIEIFREGIAGANATFDTEAPAPEAWEAKFYPDCRWVIADADGTVVGWAALQLVSSRVCFSGIAEVSIYLREAAQGKGLGKLLLSKLIDDSEVHGFWTLQSGIFPENLSSIALHEKLGFRTVGIRERMGQMNGVWRDVILLERRSSKVG